MKAELVLEFQNASPPRQRWEEERATVIRFQTAELHDKCLVQKLDELGAQGFESDCGFRQLLRDADIVYVVVGQGETPVAYLFLTFDLYNVVHTHSKNAEKIHVGVYFGRLQVSRSCKSRQLGSRLLQCADRDILMWQKTSEATVRSCGDQQPSRLGKNQVFLWMEIFNPLAYDAAVKCWQDDLYPHSNISRRSDNNNKNNHTRDGARTSARFASIQFPNECASICSAIARKKSIAVDPQCPFLTHGFATGLTRANQPEQARIDRASQCYSPNHLFRLLNIQGHEGDTVLCIVPPRDWVVIQLCSDLQWPHTKPEWMHMLADIEAQSFAAPELNRVQQSYARTNFVNVLASEHKTDANSTEQKQPPHQPHQLQHVFDLVQRFPIVHLAFSRIDDRMLGYIMARVDEFVLPNGSRSLGMHGGRVHADREVSHAFVGTRLMHAMLDTVRALSLSRHLPMFFYCATWTPILDVLTRRLQGSKREPYWDEHKQQVVFSQPARELLQLVIDKHKLAPYIHDAQHPYVLRGFLKPTSREQERIAHLIAKMPRETTALFRILQIDPRKGDVICLVVPGMIPIPQPEPPVRISRL